MIRCGESILIERRGCVGSFNRLVLQVVPVKDVVLEDEEDVESDGEEAEAELGKVPENGEPIVVVEGQEEHLEEAEAAAGKVEEDISDGPAGS